MTASPHTPHTPHELLPQLQQVPILQGLPAAFLDQLARTLIVKRLAKAEHVMHKGGAADYLYFLLSGRLQAVDLTSDGKEIGLSFLTVGDYFGELSIIDGLPRSASVLALEPSTVALLPRSQAQALIYGHPQVAENVMQRLTAAVRSSSNYRAILGIPNAHQRVYSLIQLHARPAADGRLMIERLPTQQEMAIMVNTSRETVSRALQELIQRGIIEKAARRLVVRQPAQLQAAASGLV